MKPIKIGLLQVGGGAPCVVVAEIGINHNGFVHIAKAMIDAAINAGADAVKFQKRNIEIVYDVEDLKRRRQIPPNNGIIRNAVERGVLDGSSAERLKSSGFEDTTNGDLKRALEFTREEYAEISAYCSLKGIPWFGSPWDETSVDFLEQFNVPCHKIASASLTDVGLLKRIRNTGKPVILSTGMSTLEEIDQAVSFLDREKLVILHTVSTYPTEDGHLNMNVIRTLQDRYPNVPIGYSGHEKGILPSIVAASMGACMIERHLTLDVRMWGSDQAASIEPDVLASLVKQVKIIPTIMGDGKKTVLTQEAEIMKKLRRKYF